MFEILNMVWMRVYCATVINMKVHKLYCDYQVCLLAWVRITKQNANIYRKTDGGEYVQRMKWMMLYSWALPTKKRFKHSRERRKQFWRHCWRNCVWGWQTPALQLEGVIPTPSPCTNVALLFVPLSVFMKPHSECHLRSDLD